MVMGVFVGIWVARYLGPEDYGVLSYSLSFVGIFAAFSRLGLDNIVVRDLVERGASKNKILGSSLVLKAIGALVLLIFVFIILQFTSTSVYEKSIVMIIASGEIFVMFDVIDFYYKSQVKAKFSGIAGIASLIISYGSRLAFILAGFSVAWFAVAVIVEKLIKATTLILFYHKQDSLLMNWEFSLPTTVYLLKQSWPLIITSSLNMVYMKIDQVIIREMLGKFEVGQYAAAVKISDGFNIIGVVITLSLFPSIVKAKKDSKLYKSRLSDLYKLLIWGAIFLAVIFTIVGEKIIVLLFGVSYMEAGRVLVVHIWTTIFFYIGMVVSKVYIIENIQRLSIIRSLIAVSVNVVLNIFFINIFGIIGAAYATLISHIIGAYLMNLVFKESKEQFRLITKAFLFK